MLTHKHLQEMIYVESASHNHNGYVIICGLKGSEN